MKREREEETKTSDAKRSCVEEEEYQYDRISIYTDGSCLKSGNSGEGPGGWASIIQLFHEDRNVYEFTLKNGSKKTTSNIMELSAAAASLDFVNKKLENNVPISLTTDSNYVKNGITQWIKNWKRNGWKTANKTDVKNQKIWKMLDKNRCSIEDRNKSPIQFLWTKAHMKNGEGDPNNERVDKLAREEATIMKNSLK